MNDNEKNKYVTLGMLVIGSFLAVIFLGCLGFIGILAEILFGCGRLSVITVFALWVYTAYSIMKH